jgi:hypothetical protein
LVHDPLALPDRSWRAADHVDTRVVQRRTIGATPAGRRQAKDEERALARPLLGMRAKHPTMGNLAAGLLP